MTWLFTQVWLWSLAAFVLGSLITWLLFVRPLKQRLRALLSEGPQQEPYYDDADATAEHEPLDLLGPELPADAVDTVEEPPVGDWDRVPRPWMPPIREAGREDPPKPPASAPADPTPKVSVEPSHRDEAPQPTAKAQELSTEESAHGAEKATDVASGSAEAVPPMGQVTWFHRPAPEDDPADQPTGSAETQQQKAEPDLSEHLRSLFEPLVSSDIDQQRREAPHLPPVGPETTQQIPAVNDPQDAPEATSLPRRTPGAGPHPGSPDSGFAAQSAQPAPENVDRCEAAKDASRDRDNDQPIKGHFASRQYHTPDSPQYERIVAEVWFRSAADAEQAGFEPWDGRTRSPKNP